MQKKRMQNKRMEIKFQISLNVKITFNVNC